MHFSVKRFCSYPGAVLIAGVLVLVMLVAVPQGAVEAQCIDGDGTDNNITCDTFEFDWQGNGGDDTMTVLPTGNVDFMSGNNGDDFMINNGVPASGGGVNVNQRGGVGRDTIINNSFVGNEMTGSFGFDSMVNNGDVGFRMRGDQGHDTLVNNGEVPVMEGNAGNDELLNTGNTNNMFGGAGNDYLRNTPTGTVDGFIFLGPNDGMFGGAGDDIIINEGFADELGGNNDEDLIINAGNTGDIDGGNQDDLIINFAIADDVLGGAGDDTIINTGITDFIDGDYGDYSYGVVPNTVIVGADVNGNDSIVNEGIVGATIYGDLAAAFTYSGYGGGGEGNDTITLIDLAGGNDTIYNNGIIEGAPAYVGSSDPDNFLEALLGFAMVGDGLSASYFGCGFGPFDDGLFCDIADDLFFVTDVVEPSEIRYAVTLEGGDDYIINFGASGVYSGYGGSIAGDGLVAVVFDGPYDFGGPDLGEIDIEMFGGDDTIINSGNVEGAILGDGAIVLIGVDDTTGEDFIVPLDLVEGADSGTIEIDLFGGDDYIVNENEASLLLGDGQFVIVGGALLNESFFEDPFGEDCVECIEIGGLELTSGANLGDDIDINVRGGDDIIINGEEGETFVMTGDGDIALAVALDASSSNLDDFFPVEISGNQDIGETINITMVGGDDELLNSGNTGAMFGDGLLGAAIVAETDLLDELFIISEVVDEGTQYNVVVGGGDDTLVNDGVSGIGMFGDGLIGAFLGGTFNASDFFFTVENGEPIEDTEDEILVAVVGGDDYIVNEGDAGFVFEGFTYGTVIVGDGNLGLGVTGTFLLDIFGGIGFGVGGTELDSLFSAEGFDGYGPFYDNGMGIAVVGGFDTIMNGGNVGTIIGDGQVLVDGGDIFYEEFFGTFVETEPSDTFLQGGDDYIFNEGIVQGDIIGDGQIQIGVNGDYGYGAEALFEQFFENFTVGNAGDDTVINEGIVYGSVYGDTPTGYGGFIPFEVLGFGGSEFGALQTPDGGVFPGNGDNNSGGGNNDGGDPAGNNDDGGVFPGGGNDGTGGGDPGNNDDGGVFPGDRVYGVGNDYLVNENIIVGSIFGQVADDIIINTGQVGDYQVDVPEPFGCCGPSGLIYGDGDDSIISVDLTPDFFLGPDEVSAQDFVQGPYILVDWETGDDSIYNEGLIAAGGNFDDGPFEIGYGYGFIIGDGDSVELDIEDYGEGGCCGFGNFIYQFLFESGNDYIVNDGVIGVDLGGLDYGYGYGGIYGDGNYVYVDVDANSGGLLNGLGISGNVDTSSNLVEVYSGDDIIVNNGVLHGETSGNIDFIGEFAFDFMPAIYGDGNFVDVDVEIYETSGNMEYLNGLDINGKGSFPTPDDVDLTFFGGDDLIINTGTVGTSFDDNGTILPGLTTYFGNIYGDGDVIDYDIDYNTGEFRVREVMDSGNMGDYVAEIYLGDDTILNSGNVGNIYGDGVYLEFEIREYGGGCCRIGGLENGGGFNFWYIENGDDSIYNDGQVFGSVFGDGPTEVFDFVYYLSSGNGGGPELGHIAYGDDTIVNDGWIGGDIYGEFSDSGNVDGNDYILNSGNVVGNVHGDDAFVNTHGHDTIINYGNINGNIAGDIAVIGNATGSDYILNSGNTSNIFGDLVIFSGNADGDDTIINMGVVDAAVLGDLSLFGNADGDDLIVNYGEIVGNLYGDEAFGDADGDDTIVNYGDVEGDIFGERTSLGIGSGDDYIVNTGNVGGSIHGEDAFGNADGNDTIINDGNVEGNLVGSLAVFGESIGNDYIVNNGTTNLIFGDLVIVSGNADGNDTIINNGLVEQDIWGDLALSGDNESGDDSIVNSETGLINGIMFGGGGDDTLVNFGGVSLMDGGADNDLIISGDPNDNLFGNSGDDTLIGGGGEDVLNGGEGNDDIDGGADNDRIEFTGDGGEDTATGGEGDNVFAFLGEVFGKFILDSTEGDDLLDFSGYTGNPINIDLGVTGDQTVDTNSNGDLILNLTGIFEGVIGTEGNDTIIGDEGANTLQGSGGDDSIDGGNGEDTIDGGEGNDNIDGGDNDDFIEGGNGDDEINGGSGQDSLEGGEGNDTILGDVEGENDPEDLQDDLISGGNGDDVIDGGEGRDLVEGDNGDDTLNGGTGRDTVDGGIGDDLVEGGEGRDSLLGDEGNDTLRGGNGDDTLSGGDGNDLVQGNDDRDEIVGDDGADTLTGGSGLDTFYDDGSDTVTDLEAGETIEPLINAPEVVEDEPLFGTTEVVEDDALFSNSEAGEETDILLDDGNGDVTFDALGVAGDDSGQSGDNNIFDGGDSLDAAAVGSDDEDDSDGDGGDGDDDSSDGGSSGGNEAADAPKPPTVSRPPGR